MFRKALIATYALCWCGLLAGSAQARDWYIKAGATGDGSAKDKPAPLLWRALDRATRGDVFHVAQGKYHGKGDGGSFLIKLPNMVLAGGYNDDFSERDPFKFQTVLERGPGFKGHGEGLPRGVITGDEQADHSGLTIDGFILDSTSKNSYTENGTKINSRGSWDGPSIWFNSANVKIRNCVMLNPFGRAVYGMWKGEENEIVNCFAVNTFYAALSTRSAQADSVIRIKNCTVAFCWYRVTRGGGFGIVVGKQGETILENNVISFIQTEDPSYGHGVANLLANEDLVMKNNIFFQCQESYYKYLDDDNQNLLVWKPEDIADLNANAEDYMLAEAEGNAVKNPGFKPDKDFFEGYSNFVASKPGKLVMTEINEWRRMLGLPLQAEPGSPRKNYGMAYPRDKLFPNLVCTTDGVGAKTTATFESYSGGGAGAGAPASAGGEAPAAKDYAVVEFDVFAKTTDGVKELAGKPVAFKGGIGTSYGMFLLKEATKEDYACYKLLRPGETDMTRKYLFAYLLKGSEAHKSWEKLAKKRTKYNKDGLDVKGRAFYVGKDSYTYPVGVIIDEIGK